MSIVHLVEDPLLLGNQRLPVFCSSVNGSASVQGQGVYFAPVAVAAAGPVTNTTVRAFLWKGAAVAGSPTSAQVLYTYSSGVLGTVTLSITDQTKAITYLSGSYNFTPAITTASIPLTTVGTAFPQGQAVLLLCYSLDATWNHPTDSISGLLL